MLLMIFQMTSWMPFSQFSLTNTSLPHWPQKVSVETTCAACWGFWGISQFQWSIISWSISTIAFQKLLTESSHALYESLDQRVFFKSATIVIPKTWLEHLNLVMILRLSKDQVYAKHRRIRGGGWYHPPDISGTNHSLDLPFGPVIHLHDRSWSPPIPGLSRG